ncbi:MAG: hypothetical protein RL522_320 [Pseudomonadota bacterium]
MQRRRSGNGKQTILVTRREPGRQSSYGASVGRPHWDTGAQLQPRVSYRACGPVEASSRDVVPPSPPVARGRPVVVTQSLRRTLAPLTLSYGGCEVSEGLVGRRFALDVTGRELTLSVDLTPNFQTRSPSAATYVQALALARDPARLRALTCEDTLVRTRLLRVWKSVEAPQLRLVLDLGPRGRLVYAARPHLLFTGGVTLQMQAVVVSGMG